MKLKMCPQNPSLEESLESGSFHFNGSFHSFNEYSSFISERSLTARCNPSFSGLRVMMLIFWITHKFPQLQYNGCVEGSA